MSLARNVDLLRRLPGLEGLRLAERGRSGGLRSPLAEVTGFGANPGNLRMFAYVPAQLQQPRALVVVLHGCGQTAAGYDLGAGWSTLAKHYGFALAMPQQRRRNNANTCFNWFNPDDIARDGGEVGSIREMVAHMVAHHDIDAQRIFVTGLSAGGAMTMALLATCPELFAAGAVIAGLPFGVATNLRQALDGMFHSPERPARELGDLVRKATAHRGSWPKLSVWHGSADRTVNPGNADEIVKQWLDLHELPQAPMAETVVDGHPRQSWWNADGDTIVESYTITDMAHGTPLGIADNEQRYGKEGAFLIEAGISSSYHIAKFFGLTAWIRAAASPPPLPAPAPHLARSIRAAVLEQPAEPKLKPKRKKRRSFDIGAAITRALTAAGLMKS
ncbi:PHB depolymerase family esterase [Bradyrhizobium sp.]|uniref:extracellular catalytic domain type 1 short-chain-length polyhydroxyalkanoate depolymerase n=1 Tax=Bradyrhizobium sp. TaxID=376 RepID=UPI00238E8018|nr:PHB depolymerase family esterase [Bradyrhizobium sp.]MDE2377503.1 PHB depolymerase family esterase [Bradyrhizobium sp.]